ncbi:hypothetical protein B0H16DRAFT_1547284 [Mycena metata]|uniref:Uncharacterized protein n=1 Tax=Mycena metata TaxID=1033252 RepID=A0AAD7NA03_9AGAR|nr:hypothetical protein B0H16DRAFT_1547284 [Mycena metata]
MSQPGALRKKSLRIPTQPPLTPKVPPSLLQSPHLNSPVFRRTMPPRVPNVDDEWLQDTVPQHGAVKPQQETKVASEQARRTSHSSLSLHRLAGTPAVRPPSAPWTQSEPGIQRVRRPAEQDGYFVGY